MKHGRPQWGEGARVGARPPPISPYGAELGSSTRFIPHANTAQF